MPNKIVKVACPHKCDNICNVNVPEGEKIEAVNVNKRHGDTYSYCNECENRFGIAYESK